MEDIEYEPTEVGEVDREMVDVSEAPAEAGSVADDAMEVDTQDIPMLDVCLCDRFVSPLRISSSEVIVFERFFVESTGIDATFKSSSELVKFCGVKMRLWKPDWAVSDTTLEDLPPAGTYAAMYKEIVGLDALSAGQPLKEPEVLALCRVANVKGV